MKKYKRKRKPQPSKKLRRGDKVVVIAGNDRGQVGEVIKHLGEKVVVRGVNVRKRHVKKSEQQPEGGVMEIEKPVHVSNVMLCGGEDKGVKLRIRMTKEGEREFYYKQGSEEIAHRLVKKGS